MNQLSTVSPSTAPRLFARLSEVEKMDLRRASPDRLHYLAHTSLQVETGKSVEILEEVQRLCVKVISDYDNNFTGPMIPSLWKF